MRHFKQAGSTLLALALMSTTALAADSIRLRLDWSWWAGQTPMILAKEKGFYDEVDLDVEIAQGQGSKTTTMVVGENADPIGHANLSTVAQSVSAGVPITAVAGWWQQGPISLICADPSIKTPADVKGKRIGSTPTGSDGQILPAFLKANGLELTDISLVNMPGDAKFAGIASGQLDCISGDDYFYAPQLKAQGKAVSVLKYADWGVTNLGFGIVVNNEYLAQNPDIVKRFLAATRKGMEYTFAHKDEAVEIFLKVSGNTQPAEFHRSVLDAYEASLHTKESAGKPLGWMAEADWEAMNKTLAEFGSMLGKKEATAYFSNDHLPQ
ncbi:MULTISPECIES: ABC transporter substrate-binding protein [unclassified Shinella]|jgi:NitT/TauT family transport system substrate-binding protein|uniref:ABC transporter substrate-binding protein n=1 Tax=unclassified Shinella TaxID=2643062 RepID=UPI0003C541AB|nr:MULTISPECIES: ABC transporter substrate-binding protein [unclassified Shinella]MCA0338501.1 ABC transporter substrate-binding protein [Pseudomonadota bacterium]EYR84370.1 NMT1/THI5-like family protein 5 [Shinella sp. DD12]MCO5151466.1 ABC transporter substrate-binding protein [Shinella sp.]MDC7266073.1 ABC transporter substrate-binding protein [Shinella sp. HY16]MDC7272970.1 ABC transporter substrate-binding protein [Shinella sp. YZ44]